MEILRAKSAGFCRGVNRAINIARDCCKLPGKKIYTDGPLIHNKQMMDTLAEEGIKELPTKIPDNTTKENSVIIIRAHGISPERRAYLRTLNMSFKDATCPDVAVISGKVKIHAQKGYFTVIFGDPKHPEVIGILGYAEGNYAVVQNIDDVKNLTPASNTPICLVSQSTMFSDDFEKIAAELLKKYPQSIILNTICGATRERQGEISTLAQNGVEAIIVIGGKHSANTLKLAKLVERQKLPCYHIETSEELDLEHLRQYKKIGITAGASTPNSIIDDVCNILKTL